LASTIVYGLAAIIPRPSTTVGPIPSGRSILGTISEPPTKPQELIASATPE
jgi:hypothetical protein